MTTQKNENFNENLNKETVFEANIGDVLSSRRRNYTIAAAVGAIAGVGVTALSDKSNTLSLAVTGAIGAATVCGVYLSDGLTKHEDTGMTLGLTAGIATAQIGLIGCLSNYLLGNKEDSIEGDTLLGEIIPTGEPAQLEFN